MKRLPLSTECLVYGANHDLIEVRIESIGCHTVEIPAGNGPGELVGARGVER